MTDDNVLHEMQSLSYTMMYGRMYILRPIERDERYNCPDPDFVGTHNALVGIARRGETFDQFKQRWLEIKRRHDTNTSL